MVEQKMRRQLVADGDVFVFVSKNRKRCKVLYSDGTGLFLFAKRLDTAAIFSAVEDTPQGVNTERACPFH